jgi:hypothetical protein
VFGGGVRPFALTLPKLTMLSVTGAVEAAADRECADARLGQCTFTARN